MRRLWVAASTLAAGVALGACGSAGPSSTGGGPMTSSGQPGSTASGPAGSAAPLPGTTGPGSPPSAPGTPTPPHGTAPSTGTTTLSGIVRAGVEPNCLLLDGYLLVGGARDVIVPGARVTVTGEVRGDLMTTCQQGTPFMVRSATPG